MSINRILGFVFASLVVLLASLFVSLSLLKQTRQETSVRVQDRFQSFRLANELRQSSDDLTKMARLYVVTKEPRFAENFQEILDIRSGKKPRPEDYDLVYWDLVSRDGKRPHPSSDAISLDVVNVASRMESTGVPDKIHVSEAFMVRLKDSYTFEPQGEIEVKGKG